MKHARTIFGGVVGYSEGSIGSFYTVDECIKAFVKKHGWNPNVDSKMFVRTTMVQTLSSVDPSMSIMFTRLLTDNGKIPLSNQLGDFMSGKIPLNVVQIELEVQECVMRPASMNAIRNSIKSLNGNHHKASKKKRN